MNFRKKLGPQRAQKIPTLVDKAYAAGFFDGEGNVVIGLNWKGGHNKKYPVYNMRVGASQNDPKPLFWLRDRWGGTVRKGIVKNNSSHYYWQSFSRQARTFLGDVLPFLQVKSKRAKLAISYQDMVVQRGRKGRSAAYLAKLASIKSKMNAMNSKGKR